MRLDAPRLGLLTCLVGLVAGKNSFAARDGEIGAAGVAGTSTSSSSNSIVVVDTQAFPTPATFPLSEGDKMITFHKGTGVTDLNISRADLKTYPDDVTIGTGNIPSSDSAIANDGTSDSKRKRQGTPITLDTTENTVILPLSNVQYFETYFDRPLYIEFSWSNSTSSGTSSTPAFAVYVGFNATKAASNLDSADIGNNPAKPESITSSTGTAGGSSTTSTAGSTEANSGSNGGLATGAIAGIAVGCAIAGILIIALIVWFLCCRRRGSSKNSRGHDVSYASDSVTQHAMIGDKEIPGISESTPHSTYGGEEGVTSSVAGGAAGGPFGRPSMSMAPYTDRAPSPTITPPPPSAAAGVSGHRPSHSQTEIPITKADTDTSTREAGTAAGSGCRSSTPPHATRYAHLVEEGMTDDEIRRLEEEERHLDEAIEDAGRHRRTASR